MHDTHLHRWQHPHDFGQGRRLPGESRTIVVMAITAAMMLVEIATGLVFGSMALLADGLHMASHAAALSVNALAYIYARRHAGDPRFSFGTGKVNALGGFTGGMLLVAFALLMGVESVDRLLHPVPIAFDQAILVAVLGLVVNGGSVVILGHGRPASRRGDRREQNGPHDGREHNHEHGHEHHSEHGHEHNSEHGREHHHEHHDHNLRSAYLHVLADALTSVLAIGALLSAKHLGAAWMDPVMGVVGAGLVTRWSLGLLRSTSRVLLDRQGPAEIEASIREVIERHGNDRVADLHVWSIGPGIHAVILAVVSDEPRPPGHYRALLPRGLGLAHVTVEVHRCGDEGAGPSHESRPARAAARRSAR